MRERRRRSASRPAPDHPRLRSRAGGDRGATLVELLVVLGLMGLVGTLVMTVSVQTAKVLARSNERGSDTQEVRVAIDAMTRSLRGAVDPDGAAAAGTACALEGATGARCAFVADGTSIPELRSGPRQIAFFSSVYDLSGASTTPSGTRTAPALYRYALTSTDAVRQVGEVTEEVWTGSWTTATGTLAPPTRRRVLAREIDMRTTAPALFTYLAATDTAIPASGPTVGSLTSTASPLLPAGAVSRLAAVEVWVSAVHSRGGRPVTAGDTVVLPNKPQVVST